MNTLQILLVESEPSRADHLISTLSLAGHSAVQALNCEEASEMLSIQRFDAVLLGSGQPPEALAGFTAGLRKLEAGQRTGCRAALLSISPESAAIPLVDATLAPDFDGAQLAETLSKASAFLSSDPARALSVFEPDEFAEQCAGEPELMVEIIDLFFIERERELPEMGLALRDGDFNRLSRLAHTMKGSLGALHTPAGRHYAQDLELAARDGNGPLCEQILGALDRSLEELSRHLSAFRNACLCP
ncbi:MAG: response regulator [Acidobacteriota bacterium]|nr:response regulator [Acidobacteriota bacterium]